MTWSSLKADMSCNKKRIFFTVLTCCIGISVMLPFFITGVYHTFIMRTSDTQKQSQIYDPLYVRDADTTNEELNHDFEMRKQRYEKWCASNQNQKSERVGEVFIHPSSHLAVCHTPKVGCTFWKRLFRFLNKDYGKNVTTMFDIDRVTVHFTKPEVQIEYQYSDVEGKRLADDSTKVLFARDPYSRLWSGFVDKFVLPDSWMDHGMNMVKLRKGGGADKLCPSDIKFEEFLQYSTFHNRDPHWRPLAQVCDPCTFRPKFIGHMETFGADVKAILDSKGLGYLLNNHNHSNHMHDEIGLLVDYHFQLYQQRSPIRECLTPVQLAARLYKAFQINGYFSMDTPFMEDKIKKATSGLSLENVGRAVIYVFLGEFTSHPVSKEKWREQREANLVEAYRKIPHSLKDSVAKRFRADFEIFGFDSRSPDQRM